MREGMSGWVGECVSGRSVGEWVGEGMGEEPSEGMGEGGGRVRDPSRAHRTAGYSML